MNYNQDDQVSFLTAYQWEKNMIILFEIFSEKF